MAVRLFAFSFFLLIILWSIKVFLFTGVNKVDKGQISTVRKIITHEQNPDIAVFGSSVAWVHFNPKIITEITGKSSYNFGLNGTPLTQYRGLMKEFVEFSDSEVIVIAGTFDEFAGREAIAEIYRFTPYLGNGNLYNSLHQIDPDLLWKMRHVPFYTLTTLDHNFFQYSVYGHLEKFHPNDKDEVNGFSPQHKKWVGNNQSEVSKIVVINDIVVQQYKALVNLANSRNKKVVLVLPPIYKEGAKQIKNIEEVRQVFRDIAGKNNYFFDFTDSEICLNRDFFYNNTHLNANGADVFSRDFSERLKPYL